MCKQFELELCLQKVVEKMMSYLSENIFHICVIEVQILAALQ